MERVLTGGVFHRVTVYAINHVLLKVKKQPVESLCFVISNSEYVYLFVRKSLISHRIKAAM